MNSPESHLLTRPRPTGGERPAGRVLMSVMADEGGPLVAAMLELATASRAAAGTAEVASFGSSAR